MYLDKYSKKVLKYFISTDSPQDDFTIACNVKFKNVPDKDRLSLVKKCIDILKECNYIKIDKAVIGKNITYTLTNYGRHFFKISKENTFYKYWYPIITATISFVLSILVNLLSK